MQFLTTAPSHWGRCSAAAGHRTGATPDHVDHGRRRRPRPARAADRPGQAGPGLPRQPAGAPGAGAEVRCDPRRHSARARLYSVGRVDRRPGGRRAGYGCASTAAGGRVQGSLRRCSADWSARHSTAGHAPGHGRRRRRRRRSPGPAWPSSRSSTSSSSRPARSRSPGVGPAGRCSSSVSVRWRSRCRRPASRHLPRGGRAVQHRAVGPSGGPVRRDGGRLRAAGRDRLPRSPVRTA